MAISIITPQRLRRALSQVQNELDRLGFWDEAMRNVEVRLVPFGTAFGWQHYGSTGEIDIPAVSLLRLGRIFGHETCTLRDLLRHEYAHALADTHRGLLRSRQFTKAFGAAHASLVEWEFDPKHHVSAYAASDPMEDFAETFMLYVKYSESLPAHLDTAPIRRKWRFIRRLARNVRRNRRRFI